MISFNLIVSIAGILSGLYSLPYGNWEYKQKNKLSAIIIYTIGITGIFLSVYQLFV